MTIVALYSLFPLFNGIQEKFTKIIILIVYMQCAYEMLYKYYSNSSTHNINTYSTYIVTGTILISIITTECLSFMYEKRYPFLPLMLTSLICALILLKLWVQYLLMILLQFQPTSSKKTNARKSKSS